MGASTSTGGKPAPAIISTSLHSCLMVLASSSPTPRNWIKQTSCHESEFPCWTSSSSWANAFAWIGCWRSSGSADSWSGSSRSISFRSSGNQAMSSDCSKCPSMGRTTDTPFHMRMVVHIGMWRTVWATNKAACRSGFPSAVRLSRASCHPTLRPVVHTIPTVRVSPRFRS